GVINITEGLVGGPAMALTTRGTADRARDDLSLEGTLVPNYDGLSRLTKGAPAAGTELASLGVERVQALDFSVSGSIADPYVSAKPATTIAPAVLRELQRLTTTGVDLARTSKRPREAEMEETDLGEPHRRRKKSAARASRMLGQRRSDGEAEAAPTPHVRRRRAAPSARDTDTE